MISRYLLISTVALSCTACATVDLQSMAGTSETTTYASKTETNVIMNAVARLKAVFAERGFGAETSKRKMHAAADMLMNGISAESLTEKDTPYSSEAKAVPVVLADADLAMRHVDQTRRAAEIYLDLVDPNEAVDEELESLQAALLVSERALLMFRQSLPTEHHSDLQPLRTSVDGLRDITDQFGDRVRHSHIAPAPEASETS